MTYLEQTYLAQEEQDNAAHEAAVKAQADARQAANRQEYIGHELLQKYLPQYQAMQGTAGMGTSSTDATAAANAYLGRVSENNAGYAQNVAALEQQKAEVDYQRNAEKREKEYQIKETYDTERLNEAEQESDGLLGVMDSRAQTYYGTDGKLSQEDYDNLLAFYEANEARLTETGKRNAEDMLREYEQLIRDETEQKAVDRMDYIYGDVTLYDPPISYAAGTNFEVADANGTKYKVELGDEVVDTTVLDQAAKADSGEIFAYGGKLYLKKDQTVYAVNRRKNTYHGEYETLYNLYMGSDSEADDTNEQAAVTLSANRLNHIWKGIG